MRFSYRKRIKILPGVYWNVGMKSSSVSISPFRGLTFGFGPRGTRTTVSLPGTGMRWTSTSGGSSRRAQAEARAIAAQKKAVVGLSTSETLPWSKIGRPQSGQSCGGGPTTPTQPARPHLDELKEGLLRLRKPIDVAMDRNDWSTACELYLKKIKLGEQMLDVARRDGSQADIRNCERGVELSRETYRQVAAEANHPKPSSCVLPPTACWFSDPSRAMTEARKSQADLGPEPEERDVSKAGQNEFARLLLRPMAI